MTRPGVGAVSESSMMAKPSRSSVSVMQSGGTQVKLAQRTKVKSPFSRKKAPNLAMAGWLPL